MNKTISIVIVATLAIVLVIAGCAGCATFEDRQTRTKREHVHGLISVGQNISEAQRILIEEGYALYHKEPIHITQEKDYVQQLVIIGETRPTAADTFFYVTGNEHPFRKESPYVVIEAGNDGGITRVE